MKKILLIDDDQEIYQLISRVLLKGFELFHSTDLQQAKSMLKAENIDLILLDESLPDGTGTSFCAQLRAIEGSEHIPILFLTFHKELHSKLEAFNAGADDYITKPFEPLELLARVKARLDDHSSSLIKLKHAVINKETHTITLFGQEGDLVYEFTPVEYKLLSRLLQYPEKVFSREELFEGIWGSENSFNSRTIDQHMSNIRKKIKSSGIEICSLYGEGYRLHSDKKPLKSNS